MTRTRYLVASFVAPLAALALPCMLALSQVYAEADILPDGSSDDAAMRGAGIFLLIGAPALYLLAAVLYAAVGHILERMNRLRMKSAILLASAAPWPFIGVGVAGQIFYSSRVAEGIALLALMGACLSLFAALGAFAWWCLAVGISPSDA